MNTTYIERGKASMTLVTDYGYRHGVTKKAPLERLVYSPSSNKQLRQYEWRN